MNSRQYMMDAQAKCTKANYQNDDKLCHHFWLSWRFWSRIYNLVHL